MIWHISFYSCFRSNLSNNFPARAPSKPLLNLPFNIAIGNMAIFKDCVRRWRHQMNSHQLCISRTALFFFLFNGIFHSKLRNIKKHYKLNSPTLTFVCYIQNNVAVRRETTLKCLCHYFGEDSEHLVKEFEVSFWGSYHGSTLTCIHWWLSLAS